MAASKSLESIRREASEISTHFRSLTEAESRWMIIKYSLAALATILILYIIVKFKIYRLISCCATKPCAIVYNNCFNRESVNQVGSRGNTAGTPRAGRSLVIEETVVPREVTFKGSSPPYNIAPSRVTYKPKRYFTTVDDP